MNGAPEQQSIGKFDGSAKNNEKEKKEKKKEKGKTSWSNVKNIPNGLETKPVGERKGGRL